LRSRPSIRRESINPDTIAQTDGVVSIALISGAFPEFRADFPDIDPSEIHRQIDKINAR
jgi:hypothetical protein